MVSVFAAGCAFSPASAATNLDCMNSGYSAADLKAFDEFATAFGFDDSDDAADVANANVILGPIASNAVDCAGRHGWSANAIDQAKYHYLIGLLTSAFEKNPILTSDDVVRLKSAYAKADKTELLASFGEMVRVGIEEGGDSISEPSDADAVALVQLIVDAGVPLKSDKAELAGGLLVTYAIQEITSTNFAND